MHWNFILQINKVKDNKYKNQHISNKIELAKSWPRPLKFKIYTSVYNTVINIKTWFFAFLNYLDFDFILFHICFDIFASSPYKKVCKKGCHILNIVPNGPLVLTKIKLNIWCTNHLKPHTFVLNSFECLSETTIMIWIYIF